MNWSTIAPYLFATAVSVQPLTESQSSLQIKPHFYDGDAKEQIQEKLETGSVGFKHREMEYFQEPNVQYLPVFKESPIYQLPGIGKVHVSLDISGTLGDLETSTNPMVFAKLEDIHVLDIGHYCVNLDVGFGQKPLPLGEFNFSTLKPFHVGKRPFITFYFSQSRNGILTSQVDLELIRNYDTCKYYEE